uniref:Reverse transcriptase Ty1/copia-type domain-containing protein n=1 Tax=Tanacetum cinerariifolium TaxID=118510 RepID=A0A6L2M154_TANCI|nr:hypothetical protein [Tanacetum cinerariifolium]
MPALEDVGTSDFSNKDEDDGEVADLNNLDIAIQVSLVSTTRIHKDHPLDQLDRGLHEELLQFKLQEVLTLVHLPNGKRAIGTKWVFKNKTDKMGIVIRNKARLVAQGHTQEEEIDYDEVFALVARIEEIRLFLAYVSFKDFVVYQMDVKSAFLYGKIKEEGYVCQPPGFKDPDFPGRVYKVETALYGLHQAPRAWYETLSTYLLNNGFQRGKSTRPCSSKGTKVKQKNDIIFISQDKYVVEILKKFRFTEVKNASASMETKKLLKTALSRLDLCSKMKMEKKYQVNPKVSHLHAVKRIFRTIKGEAQIHARIDGKKIIITESSVRRDLRFVDEEGVDCLPNSTIFENLELMSGSTEHLVDKAVYKELNDILVRTATTASSLEAEQDSGGGPRCQEAMRDTIAQTRFENVSKLFNDSLLARARVDSTKDEQSLGEDASKQRRKITDIDADEDITLVNDQDDAEMFDVNDLHGEGVFVEKEGDDKEVNDKVQKVIKEVVEATNTAKLIVNVAHVSAAEKQEELTIEEKATLFKELLEKRKEHFAAEEKRNKPPTQGKHIVDFRTELVKGSSKRAREELTQESAKKQKVDDDKETTELKELMEIILDKEEVAIDAIPLAVKSLKIVD